MEENMQRKLFIGIIAVVVLISPAAALAGGDIYVGGPYGTKITSLPYTISAPGAYYLGGDLSYAGTESGITVNADNVTLDLMGFTLAHTGTGSPVYGIYMNGRKNVEVRNGTVLGWDIGVYEAAWNGAVGHRIINIRAVDFNSGVILHGNGHLIQGCTASSSRPGTSGFSLWINFGSGIISGCLVKNFAANGILGHASTVISGNVVIGNGDSESVGIKSYGGLVMGNQVSNCGNMGIEVLFLPVSLIGNTVSTSSSSQTGIAVTMSDTLTLMDQNTVTGPGTHYNWGASPVQWRNNAGYP
jgi:hypothetical protein